MVIPNYTRAIFMDKEGRELRRFEGESSHYQNFIDAVRSRDHADLHADVLEGHLSSALCHTGNISYRLGRPHSTEEIRDVLKNNPAMAETLGRMEEHLAANLVDPNTSPATLGVLLKMNPHKERFVGNAEADKLLTRQYREPFVVPKKV